MKLAGVQGTKIALGALLDRGAKFFRQPRRLEPRQCEMGRKRPLFIRNAKFLRGLADIGRKPFQVCRGLDPHPENAWAPVIREEAKAAEAQIHGLAADPLVDSAKNSKYRGNLSGLGVGYLTDEFERHVKILWAYPLCPRSDGAEIVDQGRKIFPHRGSNLQRNEQAHGTSGPFYNARRRRPAVSG